VNGKFSKYQKDIYDVVLDCQLEVIKNIKAGVVYKDIIKISDEKLIDGLMNLGILIGDREKIVESHAINIFIPHSISHYIGKVYFR
jgi:Xaa-Pro aminopeptidase